MQQKDRGLLLFEQFYAEVERFRVSIARVNAVNVNSQEIKNNAKKIVRNYFQNARPVLINVFTENETIGNLDSWMQNLNSLSTNNNLKSSYQKNLKLITKALSNFELDLHKNLGSNASKNHGTSDFDSKIIETLTAMIPTAALSYEQALRDLKDEQLRLSYRGTANELRECLREVVDHLAPDESVISVVGFKLEVNQTKPTQKQKIKFILNARNHHQNAIKTPIASAAAVDEIISNFGRSVFERSNISSHVQTLKAEVSRLKMYVDVILMELLELS